MTTKIKSGVIGDNSVGIDALNVTDGTNGQALVTDGSGGLSFASVGVSGIVSSADATAITIDSSENVGIGTTSPNNYSGYTALTLNNATNGAIIDFELNGTLVGEIFTEDSNTFTHQAVGSRDINFKTNTTERMRITSGGGVVVGNTSTSGAFSVYGSSGIELALNTTATNASIQSYSSSPLLLNPLGNNVAIGASTAAYPLVVSRSGTGIKAFFTNTTDADLSINLTSGVSLITPSTGTLAFGTSSTERMRIDSSGVVHAKAGFGTTPVTSCSGFSGTAGYKYLIQPVGAMEPFWAVYSGDNYKGRGKGYFRWWYGYGNNAPGDYYRRCEVDLVDKNLEFYEVMVEDMAGTTYASSAPAYEWAYWSTRQTFNTQSANTTYATSSSMTANVIAMWGQAGGHGLYRSVIGNVCSWGGLQPSDVIGAGYTGNCGTYPSTTKGVPEPYYTDCSLRLGRPYVGSASFQESTGAFSYWFNF